MAEDLKNDGSVFFTSELARKVAKSMRMIDHGLFHLMMSSYNARVTKALLDALGVDQGKLNSFKEEVEFIVGRYHGVRPDISLECEDGLISIDLQNKRHIGLEERIFQYGIVQAASQVPKGESYVLRRGKSVVVIFLCEFDLFNMKKAVYTFSMEGFFHALYGIMGIVFYVVNMKEARKGDDELAMLLRDLIRRDPKKMESDAVRETAMKLKDTEEGAIKMANEFEKILKKERDKVSKAKDNEFVKILEQEKDKVSKAKDNEFEKVLTTEKEKSATEASNNMAKDIALNLIKKGKLSDIDIAEATNLSLSSINNLRKSMAM